MAENNKNIELDGVKPLAKRFKRDHPVWFYITAVGTILGIITGFMYLAQYTGLISDSLKTNIEVTHSSSTTTPNISDIYKRAFTYDILADRQDFFRKYADSNIYGDGTVGDISSLSNKYVMEIDIGDYSVLCPQEKTEDFERLYPLLKDEPVRFYGIFTYATYFGYSSNQLVIDQCGFERK